jgi:hypothetical protein
MVEGEFGHLCCPLLGDLDGKKFGARSKRASFSYWADDHQPRQREISWPRAQAAMQTKMARGPSVVLNWGLAQEYDDHRKGRQ